MLRQKCFRVLPGKVLIRGLFLNFKIIKALHKTPFNFAFIFIPLKKVLYEK